MQILFYIMIVVLKKQTVNFVTPHHMISCNSTKPFLLNNTMLWLQAARPKCPPAPDSQLHFLIFNFVYFPPCHVTQKVRRSCQLTALKPQMSHSLSHGIQVCTGTELLQPGLQVQLQLQQFSQLSIQ